MAYNRERYQERRRTGRDAYGDAVHHYISQSPVIQARDVQAKRKRQRRTKQEG